MIADLKPYAENRGSGVPWPEIWLDAGSWITTIYRKYSALPLPGHKVAHEKAHDEAHEKAYDEAHELTDTEKKILSACEVAPRSTRELLEILGYRSRTGHFKKSMARLCEETLLIEPTLPNAPRSKKQKYRLTEKGRAWLAAQGGRP